MKDTWNMTPDEAKKYILQNWFDGDENVNAFVCGDEEYTAMAIAVEALEATRWHYPSKGEYPTDEGRVLCKLCNLSGTGDWYECGGYDKDNEQWFYENFVAANDPICWQYIVPPKE